MIEDGFVGCLLDYVSVDLEQIELADPLDQVASSGIVMTDIGIRQQKVVAFGKNEVVHEASSAV